MWQLENMFFPTHSSCYNVICFFPYVAAVNFRTISIRLIPKSFLFCLWYFVTSQHICFGLMVLNRDLNETEKTNMCNTDKRVLKTVVLLHEACLGNVFLRVCLLSCVLQFLQHPFDWVGCLSVTISLCFSDDLKNFVMNFLLNSLHTFELLTTCDLECVSSRKSCDRLVFISVSHFFFIKCITETYSSDHVVKLMNHFVFIYVLINFFSPPTHF